MTEKRWLIRTRSKQILGPASKEKIVSLIEKESLDDEDELSSGNGYWFWVKEKDLVEKYLYSGERQGFNPVTESESVLKSDDAVPLIKKEVKLEIPVQEVKKIETPVEDNELVMPDDEDLEFPDVNLSSHEVNIEEEDEEEDEMALDHTSVITLDQLSNKGPNLIDNSIALEDEESIEDLEDELIEATKEIKPLVEEVSNKSKETSPIKKETKSNVKKKLVKEESEEELQEDSKDSSKKGSKQGKKTRNDRYLFLLLIFICLLLFSVFYYYRTIINKPIPIIGIANVHAQSLTSLVKKKVQFS